MGKERKREVLQGPLDAELLGRRRSEGWTPVAVEWERVRDGDPGRDLIALPYGLRVAASGDALRPDPQEMDVLLSILAGMTEDRSMSDIAASLNGAGFSRRSGGPWTQSAVFDLLPRVIDMAPTLYASEAWAERSRLERTA